MSEEEFDQLAEGLLFMSETDAPLTYFELSLESSQQWPAATAAHFLRLIGENAAMLVEEFAHEKFFEDLRLGNEDREDQIQTLRQAFVEELQNTRGFRVGEIQIAIFILGKEASGKICGLRTLSVET